MYTYVMSDIHGDAKHFYELVERLNMDFSDDVLIIDGDILDRNDEGSLKFFYEIMRLRYSHPKNIIVIKGNHEKFLSLYLEGNLSQDRYSLYGGETTIKEVECLTEPERQELLVVLNNLPLYTVLETRKRGGIVVTHSGLDLDHLVFDEINNIDVIASIEAGSEWDEMQFLIGNDIHYAPAWMIHKLSVPMVVGHVPTIFLEPGIPLVYERCERLMCIDCGAGHRDIGGRLGCLRLDDEKVFYA